MKTKLIGALCLAGAVTVFAWRFFVQPSTRTHQAVANLKGHEFHLSVAKTEEEHRLGLSDSAALTSSTGMLFVFDRPDIYPFWMHGMLFALDIIWLDHGQVVDIATLAAPTANQDPQSHTPTGQADEVIEVKAGTAAAIGLRVGETVSFSQHP